jgi:hypothetical protein
LLPPYYIGSTKVENIQKGYHGSVTSVEWKDVWTSEIKSNPHLFETIIIPDQYIETVDEAVELERKWQIIFDVVNSPLFINRSYAKGGFHSTPASVAKGNLTRKKNGNDKRTLESVARSVETKRASGSYRKMVEKVVATRKANNSYQTGAAKALATKVLKGNNTHKLDTINKLKELKTGLKCWNDGTNNKMSKTCPGEGWIIGSLQTNTVEQRAKSSLIHKGTTWWSNGTVSKMSKICPGDGWFPGRIMRTSSAIGARSLGKLWWTDGYQNVMSIKCPGSSW